MSIAPEMMTGNLACPRLEESAPALPAASLTVAYANLNLRFNPFGRLTPEEEGALARPLVNVEALVARLRMPGFAVQFLGASGRGKSTHLFAIRQHFPEAPYLYLPAGQPAPEIPGGPVLFIDEMQRLSRRQRKDVLSRRASLVIGSHTNHANEFRRAGLAYDVRRLDKVTVARLCAILNGRIGYARRDPNRPAPVIGATDAQALIHRFGADQWAMIEYLYGRVEAMQAHGEWAFNLTELTRRSLIPSFVGQRGAWRFLPGRWPR
jgi:hypothetical protein